MSWFDALLPDAVRAELDDILSDMRDHDPWLDPGDPKAQAAATSIWCAREVVKLRDRESAHAAMFQCRIDEMTDRLYAIEARLQRIE